MASAPLPDGPKSILNPTAFFEQRLIPAPAGSTPAATTTALTAAPLTTQSSTGSLPGDATPRSVNLSGQQVPSALPLHDHQLLTTISREEYQTYMTLHRMIAEDDENIVPAIQAKVIELGPSALYKSGPNTLSTAVSTTAATTHPPFDINFQHESIYNSCTLLMHACYRQNLQLVMYLLSFQSQIDLNMQNIFSQETALFYAIIHCPIFTETTVHIVRELIQHDSDPNIFDSNDVTVFFQLMRRSCEPINDFYLDIVATLLASTIPVQLTLTNREVINLSCFRFLLTNRHQSQRSPFFFDLVTMILDHRAEDQRACRLGHAAAMERIRAFAKQVSLRTETVLTQSFFLDADTDYYFLGGMPEIEVATHPFQMYYPVVAAFMHPQPSLKVIKALLNATHDVKVRSILGPNRCSLIYTLFSYIENLDDEIVQIVQYMMKLHARQSADAAGSGPKPSSSSLLRTTMAVEALSQYPTRDLVGPKLLPCTPLPLLASGKESALTWGGNEPTTPVNRGAIVSNSANPLTGSLKKKPAFSFSSPPTSAASFSRGALTADPHAAPVPTYLSQNRALLTQLQTLYQNLTQIESAIHTAPFATLQNSVLFADKIYSPLEQAALPFFQKYPLAVTQLGSSTPYSAQFLPLVSTEVGLTASSTSFPTATADFTHGVRGSATDHLNQLLKVYEIGSQTPMAIDYHPFSISSSDGAGVWPINRQNVLQVPLISSFLFFNRWRWSKHFQQICELLTGQPLALGSGSPRRLYTYLHLLLMSPCPDYSIFYRLASLNHQNASRGSGDDGTNGLPVIERGLIYYLSNPNIDAPDHANAAVTASMTASQLILQTNLTSSGSLVGSNSGTGSGGFAFMSNPGAMSSLHSPSFPFTPPTSRLNAAGLPHPHSPSAPFQIYSDASQMAAVTGITASNSAATPTAGAGATPAGLLRQSSLTTSSSGPTSTQTASATPPASAISEEVTMALQQGRLGVYTNQKRIHVISVLSTPGKSKDITLPLALHSASNHSSTGGAVAAPVTEDNIVQLTAFLIKHFHARPNYTVRIGHRTVSALSCIASNSAIPFDTALTLFDSMIAPRLTSTGSTYVPSSAAMFWPDGSLAIPKSKDLPTPAQGLVAIEMAVFEVVEWFIHSSATATSYLNIAALLFVLVKMRGVKINDIRRGSPLYTTGERIMGLTRVSQEERTAKLHAQAHGESPPQGRERRGTVVGAPSPGRERDRKMSTLPTDAKPGRRGTVAGGQGPGGRRGTVAGGQGPRGAVPNVDLPECQNWSLMALLLCFGNYDAVGVFELYSFLDWNGNPMQPPPGIEQSLYNTNPHFSDTYRSNIQNQESIAEILKYILYSSTRATPPPGAQRSGGPGASAAVTVVHPPTPTPNFCTSFGQFVLRRGLFLMQFIIKTEEIHPNVLIWEKIAEVQLQLFRNEFTPKNNKGGTISRLDSSLSASRTQAESNPITPNPSSLQASAGGADNDEEDDDVVGELVTLHPAPNRFDNAYPDDDDDDDDDDSLLDDDDDDDDDDSSDYAAFDFGATGSKYTSGEEVDFDLDGRRTTTLTGSNILAIAKQDAPIDIALKSMADELTTQALAEAWVKPEWSPSFVGPRYGSLALRVQNDPGFIFTEFTAQLLLQSVVSTPNPNRAVQYHLVQFILVNFADALRPATAVPFKHDLSGFGPTSGASSVDALVAGSSGTASGEPVVALEALGEDEIAPLRSTNAPAAAAPVESRGRRGTVAGGGARARSTSRARGGSIAVGPSGEGKSDFILSISGLLHTASAYDFYSILTITAVEEHFTTSCSMPLHMSHVVPWGIPRRTRELTQCSDMRTVTRNHAKFHSPQTLYSRANILTLLSMTHIQPITVVFLFLFEYFIRRFYHRLAAHLAIESNKSVVIQICTPIQISPLFVFLHFSKLNPMFNPYLPTISIGGSGTTGGFNPGGMGNTFFVPTLQCDLEPYYQPGIAPAPIMTWTNTTSNIYRRYQRGNPNILSTPIALTSGTALTPTHNVSLFTPQLINMLLQFETDYGRWIQPIDPAHLRSMYKYRPERLHTGGRYNYKTTITYPMNMLTYFFLAYRSFFLRYSSGLTSVHAAITSLMLKHGHCPNLSAHDDDDVQQIVEYTPTPLHVFLSPSHCGLTYTPALNQIVDIFFNNRNFDPEVGAFESLVHLPFRCRTPTTVHQNKLVQIIVKNNVNILKCDGRDNTNILHHSFASCNRPYVFTPHNLRSICYLLASGVSPAMTYQSEDQGLIGLILAHSSAPLIRLQNYNFSKHNELWQLQMALIFYIYFFLTPNNVAPNVVLALAFHPNQRLKELLFGIEDWSTTRASAVDRAWAETYFSNPYHFGSTSFNAASSAVQEQSNPHLGATFLTPGYISLPAEFNPAFIAKYKNMSLDQFLTMRQAELAADPTVDYSIYDILALMDHHRSGVTLPSFFSIAQRFKAGQPVHGEQLADQEQYEAFSRKHAEVTKLIIKQRTDAMSAFPDTAEREKDQIVYKGLLWFLSDYTNTLPAPDALTLMAVSKSKLSPVGTKFLTQLSESHGNPIQALSLVEAATPAPSTLLKALANAFPASASTLAPALMNEPSSDLDLRTSTVLQISTGAKLLKPIDICTLNASDCVIDCSTINSFRENIIHIAILRKWPAQTIKPIYLQAAYQFSIKFADVFSRAFLPQPEQLAIEAQILADPTVNQNDKRITKALREQYNTTGGVTMTKLQLDFALLFHDARGYSPLQYFYFTLYDLDSANYMDQVLNNQFVAGFVSKHHVKYTRYLEYQGFSATFPQHHSAIHQQLLAQHTSSLCTSPSQSSPGSHEDSLMLLTDSVQLATLPSQQRNFLQLSEAAERQTQFDQTADSPNKQVEGVHFSKHKQLQKYDISTLSGHVLDEAQALPFFSSLAIMLSFDFNLFSPLPANPKLFATLPQSGPSGIQSTAQTYPNLHALFSANLPLPIALIPQVDLSALSQGHLWINLYDFDLRRNSPPQLKPRLINYSISYPDADVEKHADVTSGASRLTLKTPSIGSLSSPGGSGILGMDKLKAQHPYLQKLGGGSALSPKPKTHVEPKPDTEAMAHPESSPSAPEISQEDELSALNNHSTPSNLGLSQHHDPASTSHMSGHSLAAMLEDADDTKVTLMSPLSEDDGDTGSAGQDRQRALVMQKLVGTGAGENHEFYGMDLGADMDDNTPVAEAHEQGANDEPGSSTDKTAQPQQKDGQDDEGEIIEISTDTVPELGAAGAPAASPTITGIRPSASVGPSSSIRASGGGKFASIPAVLAQRPQIVSIQTDCLTDPVDPTLVTGPTPGVVFDYDMHILEPYMSLSLFLNVANNGQHRKLINAYTHNNTTHRKYALLTHQTLHEYLFALQKTVYYQSLSLHDQLGVEITMLSDTLGTPLDFTKPETMPPKPEVLMRRLSHTGSNMVIFRRPRVRERDAPPPKSPGDATAEIIPNMPVSLNFMALQADFANPLSYTRYFNVRYTYAVQQIKTVPCRSPTWLQYAKIMYYREFDNRGYEKWYLPAFAYPALIHEALAAPREKIAQAKQEHAEQVAAAAAAADKDNDKKDKKEKKDKKKNEDKSNTPDTSSDKKGPDRQPMAEPTPGQQGGCCVIM